MFKILLKLFTFLLCLITQATVNAADTKYLASCTSLSLFFPMIERESNSESDSIKKYSYFDIGSSYNTNNNLSGQFSNVVVQPAWLAMASLTGKSGFDVSLNYSLIQNSDTTFSKLTSSVDLDVGYAFDFLKYFNLQFAISHTFQPKNTSSLKKGFDNSLYAGLGYDYDWFYGGLSSTYMLGNRVANKTRLNSLSFNWSNNLMLSIDDFPGKDNSISMQPGFTLGFSDQKLYNNYLLSALIEDPKPLIAKLLKKRPKLTVAEAIAILKAKTVKGQRMLATSFGLNAAVAINIGDCTITITPSAYKPINQPTELVDNSWKFMIELGVVYSFSW
jgi:hypothetical protein